MTTEFLHKDPTQALIEVKEKLYGRLTKLRGYLKNADRDDYGYLDFADCQIDNEVIFLQNLLDIIENS